MKSLANISFLSVTAILFLHLGCKINDVSTETMNKFDLCFNKQINNKWAVILYNSTNQSSKNISLDNNDYFPTWSPDGSLIIFTRYKNDGGTDIMSYNIEKNIIVNITNGKTTESYYSPIWTKSGNQIIFNYHKIGEKENTQIMNKDGSDKKKILDFCANIFFSNDDNSFVYQPNGTNSENDYTVFKYSLINNNPDLILDLKTVGEEYTQLYGYNQLQNKILLLIASTPRITDLIATYDLNSKTIDTISVADSGWIYLRPQYSNDYSKILFEKKNYNGKIDKLILCEKVKEKEIISLADGNSWFDFNSISFSATNDFLAYTKNINQSSQWAAWESYVYVVDLNTLKNIIIDSGHSPQWNPR